MGKLCKADLLDPRYLGLQDQRCKMLLGDGFSEALDSNKWIRIPVYISLWKFVDSNQNIEAEICWNFCSIGYERCVALWKCIGKAVPDDLSRNSSLTKRLKKHLTVALSPIFLDGPWQTQNSSTLILLNVFDHWSWFGSASSESVLLTVSSSPLSLLSSPPSSAKTQPCAFLRLLDNESINLFIHTAK